MKEYVCTRTAVLVQYRVPHRGAALCLVIHQQTIINSTTVYSITAADHRDDDSN